MGSSRQSAHKKLIICDCMLGKLAKILRVLGYNVYYNPKAADDYLISLSRRHDAILLTRDKELSKLYERSIYVRDHEVNKQVIFVLRALKDIGVEPLTGVLEICPECGTPIVECDREYIKGNYHESTYCAYDVFYYCPNCGKVYWEGYQYKSLRKTIEEIEDNINGLNA
ncbi:MAG: hypothetical protein J7J27_01640 [Euryarchaeota archaeon]|nr:hypothetical protein [Euryarchaeota archaeon]